MTVSSTTTRNSYTGDGSTTVFAYTFKIFDDDDITVILRTTATGAETVQTKTTNYSVSGVGNAGGGNITFTSAPASTQTVVLLRQTAQTQSTDYTPNDPFPAAAHEDALDKLTLLAQDQQDELDRAIKLSRTNTMTSTEFTVGSTDRANKVLAFDSSGELAVTQELGTFQGTDATVTTAAYVERDIIKSTTTAQLNNIYICVAASVIGDSLTDTDHFALIVDAVSAATSATNAASSATAAASSATAAATSETNAATSETNAATSATTATTKASEAATSATNAATSATNAGTSETNAASSATAAASSATSAASSATTATTKASEASTSATNAATSETNAATSATNAATSATNASTSETNAATSATTATTQATNASSSATAAAASAAAAAASADNFDDTYLGAKSSDPSTDNDGDALNAGDLYFNTTSNNLKVYTGSAWADAALTTSDFLTVANNLSDLNNAGTARTNLGLGTIATQAANSVAITGGSVAGITDLAIADGGTGASTASAARTNLGLGTAATAASSDFLSSSGGTLSGTLTLGSNVINDVEDIYLRDKLYHDGDTDTYLGFGTNQINFYTGNSLSLRLYENYLQAYENVVASVHTDTSNTGTVTPDFQNYNSFVWTLTGNVTLGNPTTEVTGMSGVFIFIQDGTGSRTVSLGTDYETAGAAGLTLSTAASSVDIVPYFVQASGNILLGAPQLAFS